ncbi:MAG TPA: DUF1800 family protein [Mycobacteriales bacterium]|nr:DUF1800 family protein [Mycobacteriales bacterium]
MQGGTDGVSTVDRRGAGRVAVQVLVGRDRKPPTAPSKLHGTATTSTVTLGWKAAHDNRKVTHYEVFRNGHLVGKPTRTSFTDKKLLADHAYAYAVRAVDKAGNRGKKTHVLTIRTRKPATGPTGPTAPTGPTGPTGPTATPLTTPMVDRMFWRAGFGPSQAERDAWSGKPVADLVDFFVSHPQSYDPTVPPPVTQSNQPIDPLVSSDELVMEWLYSMQTATNPLTERLTFFLHRHWCITRLTGEITNDLLIAYRNRLRSFADLAANPTSSFKDLAYEMTTQDGAMSLFLNGWQNVKGHPNENYAREFMELFCLGVRDASGAANYTQTDVTEMARALTGWHLDQNPGPTFGNVSFRSSSFDAGSKTIFGQAANWGADPAQGSGTASAIDHVLQHHAHAPYIVRKLWGEFIAAPIPDDALAALVTAYVANGAYQLKPLVRGILSHPLMFDSLDEPNMVKPPVVYLVGMQRALGAPMKWFWQHEVLGDMQQSPYEAPNVAGWEGGLSFLNTNTADARFDAVLRTLFVNYDNTSGTSAYPNRTPLPDIPTETAAQCFDRAYALCGSPWLSAASTAQIQSFSAAQPASTANARLQRLYAVMALIFGGPDGQVM